MQECLVLFVFLFLIYSGTVHNSDISTWITVQILCIGTDRSQKTVQTKIRLLLKKQSDQGIRCLPFHQHLFDCFFFLIYSDTVHNSDISTWITVQILCIGTDRSQQTVQTKIRLLLKKQSDQGLCCLPFHQHLLDALMQCYIKLFYF